MSKTTINNSTFIKTSEWLALKRLVLNPNNNDNKCFQYSVIPSLHHEQTELSKTREKQVILLIISDEQTQHYDAVKNLNSLLKEKN